VAGARRRAVSPHPCGSGKQRKRVFYRAVCMQSLWVGSSPRRLLGAAGAVGTQTADAPTPVYVARDVCGGATVYHGMVSATAAATLDQVTSRFLRRGWSFREMARGQSLIALARPPDHIAWFTDGCRHLFFSTATERRNESIGSLEPLLAITAWTSARSAGSLSKAGGNSTHVSSEMAVEQVDGGT